MMQTTQHGLSVGIDRVGDNFYLNLKAVGKLTHEDYQEMTPKIDSALQGVPNAKIKAIVDASEFEGWGLHAAWDDFRLGLKHRKEFEKIAIFGNKKWQNVAAKIGAWFISGEIEYFESEKEARDWLKE